MNNTKEKTDKEEKLLKFKNNTSYLFFLFSTIGIIFFIWMYCEKNQDAVSVKLFLFVMNTMFHEFYFRLILILNIIFWIIILFVLIIHQKDFISYFLYILYPIILLYVLFIEIGLLSSPKITEYIITLFEINKQFNWDKIIYGVSGGFFLILLNIFITESVRFYQYRHNINSEQEEEKIITKQYSFK